MEELLKLIKANMKEGADIAAIETLAKGLDVLAGVKTVDDAKEFIRKNDLLNKANDSNVSIAVQSHDDKFTKDKLPGLLKEEREKTIKEVNPEESKDQKIIREQKERIDALEATGKRSDLKTTLLSQAKELGYSGNVDLFLGHGEKAGDFLKSEAKRFKTAVDERVSSDIKKLYGDIKPKTSEVSTAKTMKKAEFDQLDQKQKTDFIRTEKGVVVE